ncbi:MAG: hypothetical protein ACKO0N_05815 [Planctomycetota bacterium]|jgi:hypothetical protein
MFIYLNCPETENQNILAVGGRFYDHHPKKKADPQVTPQVG